MNEGSIYQRTSDGRWVGKFIPPKDPLTGKKSKPKYVYSSLPGNKGKQEVRRKLNKLKEEIEKGDLSNIYKITLEGWLKKYLKVYCTKIEKTTRNEYEHYIYKHIIPGMGDLLLHDIKPIHVQSFYNAKREEKLTRKNKKGELVPVMRGGEPAIGYSERTILHLHRILHGAFSKAVVDGMMPQNPCEGVDTPSPEEYEPVIYTEEQFSTLVEKLKGHPLEAAILIAGMCGLRRGELMALCWEDINFKDGTVSVTKNAVATKGEVILKAPKNNKSREMAIPPIIMPRLKQLRGIGRIYVKPNGENYSPGNMSNSFARFLKKNNLPHIRLHDLRHFNCTMMLQYGVTEREAMERSGHLTPAVIRKYQHVLKEMDKKNAEKLNNVLKKQAPR